MEIIKFTEFWRGKPHGNEPFIVAALSPEPPGLLQNPIDPTKSRHTYTLLSVIDMESSVVASLEISLSLALVAGANM